MGDPRLNYQTGRFAASVEPLNVTKSPIFIIALPAYFKNIVGYGQKYMQKYRKPSSFPNIPSENPYH